MDIKEIERMTPYEYDLKMTAYHLKKIDQEQMISYQAWQNQAAKAVKEVGAGKNKKTVSIYKDFNDFFDYESRINDLLGIEKDKLASNVFKQLVRKANS